MPRKNVREERRTQIFEALNKCLLKKPFYQTSIKDIAKTAGVNHGILHYYFESKEDLLLNFIDYTIDKYKSNFYQWLSSSNLEKLSESELLAEIFDFVINKITLNRSLSKIFIEIWEIAIYNKTVRSKLQGVYSGWEHLATELIMNMVGDVEKAKNISIAIMAFFEGISLFSIIFKKKDIDNNVIVILKEFQRIIPDIISWRSQDAIKV